MCNDFLLLRSIQIKMMYFCVLFVMSIIIVLHNRATDQFLFVWFRSFFLHADAKSMHSNSIEWRDECTGRVIRIMYKLKLNSNH